MALYARWVFEARATDDAFRRALAQALEARGFEIADAKAYDFSVRGDGARAFVQLAYHERGIELRAKVKGFPGRPRRLADELLDAGRAAQAALLFGRARETPRGG